MPIGITAADVNQQLRGTNVDLGSGRGQVAGNEQTIRTLGDARDRGESSPPPRSRCRTAVSSSLSELGTITDTYRGAEVLLALQRHIRP